MVRVYLLKYQWRLKAVPRPFVPRPFFPIKILKTKIIVYVHLCHFSIESSIILFKYAFIIPRVDKVRRFDWFPVILLKKARIMYERNISHFFQVMRLALCKRRQEFDYQAMIFRGIWNAQMNMAGSYK